MKLNDVLDEIKAKNGFKANAELGRLLDIDKRRIGEYYSGREPMDDDYAKIAMASGRRIDELQAIVKLSVKTDEKSLEVWRKYYKSIGGIAASFMLYGLVVVNLVLTWPNLALAEQDITKSFLPCYKLCVYWIRKIIAIVRHKLYTCFPRGGFAY